MFAIINETVVLQMTPDPEREMTLKILTGLFAFVVFEIVLVWLVYG